MRIAWPLGAPRPCAGQTFGVARQVRQHPDRCLDHWVLGLPLSGSLPVQVGDLAIAADPGGYYLLPPGVPHRGHGETSADVAFLHFRCPDPAPILHLPLHGPRPRHLDYGGWFAFLREAADAGTLDGDTLAGQMAAMLGQLACEGARPQVPTATRAVAEAVHDVLRLRYAEPLDAAHLSRLTGYSYGHLDRCFRRTFGTGIHRRLVAIRIEAARSQLLHGRTVRAVAAACGFPDEGHFRKTFARLTGLPPGRFAGGTLPAGT